MIFDDDREDKERAKALQNVELNAKFITGEDIWGDVEGSNDSRILWSEYGLCHDCEYFRAVRTEYGKMFAQCELFDKTLNTNDPVTSCTKYSKKGQMNLRDMKEIAVIIDPDKKDKVGFRVD